jgi:hypothetical protein
MSVVEPERALSMTHKRSRRRRIMHREREKEDHDLKLLKYKERTTIWASAVWDHERDEVTNRVECFHNFDQSNKPLQSGDVLVDSRNQGVFQYLRIPAYGR